MNQKEFLQIFVGRCMLVGIDYQYVSYQSLGRGSERYE